MHQLQATSAMIFLGKKTQGDYPEDKVFGINSLPQKMQLIASSKEGSFLETRYSLNPQ